MIHSIGNYQNNDFIKQHTNALKALSHHLYKSKKIKVLSYNRQYDDGTTLTLCTHDQWFDNYFAKYKMGNYVYGRLSSGVNYWNRINDKFLQEIQEDAAQNFDISGVIEGVYRDSTKHCYHLYAFYADTKNADKICAFYQKHKAELLRMLSNLNSHGFEDLHGEDEKTARFQHTGYHLPKGYLQYYKQCKALLHEKNYYKLSDHEVGATRSRLLNCCTMMQPSVPPLVSYLNVRIE